MVFITLFTIVTEVELPEFETETAEEPPEEAEITNNDKRIVKPSSRNYLFLLIAVVSCKVTRKKTFEF